jgi:hypothetical protein
VQDDYYKGKDQQQACVKLCENHVSEGMGSGVTRVGAENWCSMRLHPSAKVHRCPCLQDPTCMAVSLAGNVLRMLELTVVG